MTPDVLLGAVCAGWVAVHLVRLFGRDRYQRFLDTYGHDDCGTKGGCRGKQVAR